MRILLGVDGEGISQISDHRECWPAYPQYWTVGRSKFTADLVAAARGLLRGGASEVLVFDGHGDGTWHNVLIDQLPEGVRMFNSGSDAFDSWFQVGAHSRCGTPNGFISHTNVPYFRVAINGNLATESHLEALEWGSLPIGITGDAALDPELDDFLSGVPFLPVKRSRSRTATQPLSPEAEASAEAIQSFAEICAKHSQIHRKSSVPKTFKVSFSFDPILTKKAEGVHGLRRSSQSVLSIRVHDWKRFEPAYEAARIAALEPYIEANSGVDLSSEKEMKRQDPRKLRKVRSFIETWTRTNYPAWRD